MKKIRNFVVIATMLFASGAMFTSCIKEEALNAEADIVKATIDNAKDLLQVAPSITNDKVTFKLKHFTPNMSMDFAPKFVLTEGATIEPASGTQSDFSKPQVYTVKSQDGMWEKEYTVEFVVDEGALLGYTFEYVTLEDTKYKDAKEGDGFYKFYDFLPDMINTKSDWNSGNAGYDFLISLFSSITGGRYTPDVYPTSQSDDGFEGKCAIMTTRSTGSLGGMFGSPLAAGSLFLGDFILELAPSAPLEATRFGVPYGYDKAPEKVSGYFTYHAGENFKINNGPSELTEDTWDAYAILFEKIGSESEDDADYLTGSHNFEDPRIVSVARISDEYRIKTEEWTSFEMDFEYVNGKTFDPNKEYMFTIVFSSSKEGAIFNGAVDSTLKIDEVKITTAEYSEIEE